MIEAIDGVLRGNPIALLFVILAAGYLIGKTNIRGFEFGPVTGVLFAGLVFGHFGYELSASAQTFGFVMFIFSVGFQAGPSFFEVLRQEGAKHFVLALVVAATGFSVAAFLGGVFDFPIGTSAGLLAGAMTTTPALAAAQDALQSADFTLPTGMVAADAVRNVTTAYAITYLFGLVGLIIIIRTLPGLLGIDLTAEAKKIGGEESVGVISHHIDPFARTAGNRTRSIIQLVLPTLVRESSRGGTPKPRAPGSLISRPRIGSDSGGTVVGRSALASSLHPGCVTSVSRGGQAQGRQVSP